MECPICKENAHITTANSFNNDSRIKCQNCGTFIVSEDFLKFPEPLPLRRLRK